MTHKHMHYRCRTHTMSKAEYEQLSRDIYLANCFLTAKEKRKQKEQLPEIWHNSILIKEDET